MTATVRDVYAVEHGDYSDRRTDVIFDARADAEAYVAAMEAIAKALNEDIANWVYPHEWEIVTYQLWTGVPVVKYDDDDWVTTP